MKILIVAGEASADLHASHVVRELQNRGEVKLLGIGGDRLMALGLRPIKTARDMAVVGLSEAIKKIPQTLRLLKDLEKLAAEEKPNLALLLDLPDFNLRLAPRLKRLGIPVVYYIAPQVWAWRAKRVHQMAECIDRLLTIFPFEPDWYRQHAPRKLEVRHAGHPVVDEIPDAPYEPERNKIAVLPGSRESEFSALWPDLVSAMEILAKSHRDLNFVLPLAETLRDNPHVRSLLDEAKKRVRLHVEERPAHEVLRTSRAAVVASGTATLETAVVGVPMVVVYRVAPLSAFIFRNFIGYVGPVAMANLVHVGFSEKERVVPELLQEEASPARIARELEVLLTDEGAWTKQRDRLAGTRQILISDRSPILRAADEVENLFRERKGSA